MNTKHSFNSLNISDEMLFILKQINNDKLDDIKKNSPTINNDWAVNQFNIINDIIKKEIETRSILEIDENEIFISNADREEGVELFTMLFKKINMEYAFYKITYYRF